MRKWMMLGLLMFGTAQTKAIKMLDLMNLGPVTASTTQVAQSRTSYDLTYTQKSGRVLAFGAEASSKPGGRVVNRVVVDIDAPISDYRDSEAAYGAGYVLGFFSNGVALACYNATSPQIKAITTFVTTSMQSAASLPSATYVKEFGNTQVRLDFSQTTTKLSLTALKIVGRNFCTL